MNSDENTNVNENGDSEISERKDEVAPAEASNVETTSDNEVRSEPNTQKEKAEEETTDYSDLTSISIASANFMDIIMNDKSQDLSILTTIDQGSSSMALSVGSKVEAKDFGDVWYPAEIVEVDDDEMEVLVHYDDHVKRHDEWINVSSNRLRPYTKPAEPPDATARVSSPVIYDMSEQKTKHKFEVGERCLARWKNNSRFAATIRKELDNDKYEIVFDDGANWTCSVTRLFKMKQETTDSPVHEPPHLATPVSTSPISHNISQSPVTPLSNTLPFHTHLFDPARDHLGSKSERREQKRKWNVKALFNIGQPRKKFENDTPVPYRRDRRPVVNLIKTEFANRRQIASKVNKPSPEPEVKLVKFEDVNEEKHEQTICKMKQAINKLEVTINSLNKLEGSPTPKPKDEDKIELEDIKTERKVDLFDTSDTALSLDYTPTNSVIEIKEEPITDSIKIEPDSTEDSKGYETKPVKEEVDQQKLDEMKRKRNEKIRKARKLRLFREKMVKKEVEKVMNEMKKMKRQVAEMKKQVKMKTEEARRNLISGTDKVEIMSPPPTNESYLLPGEWCCKWVNGQPQGVVVDTDDPNKQETKSRRLTIEVEDKRLPPLWRKMMVRRNMGSAVGKWDVLLLSPENRKLHTKSEMKVYLETVADESLKPYEAVLLDFGLHRKLSRRLGWDDQAGLPRSPAVPTTQIPKKIKANRNRPGQGKTKKRRLAQQSLSAPMINNIPATEYIPAPPLPPLEDGYVYVGSLKVQIIENLLRCPAEGCFKNFRNDTLLRMHVKHYHRELRKAMGATPKVADLAYARALPTELEVEPKPSKPRAHKPRRVETETKFDIQEHFQPLEHIAGHMKPEHPKMPKSLDSPIMRAALMKGKPVKRARVLLPVRPEDNVPSSMMCDDSPNLEEAESNFKEEFERKYCLNDSSLADEQDFEASISMHTVFKTAEEKQRKGLAKLPMFPKERASTASEDDDWASDFETRSSYPRSGSPDSKILEFKPVDGYHQLALGGTEDHKEGELYITTETGERVKIVHMKREEIINCHCGFRGEDGLMIQCELCLCWQHAVCHNIQRETEVPEKYTCSICLNPRRGRRSQRFLHDQDRLYEGLLPGGKPCDSLKRSHELSGNLLRIDNALQALKIKYYVATKKDHPKLYLWAKDWEHGDTQSADFVNPNDCMSVGAVGPQPEAAIENSVCRERLLRHIQRCHALLDARLDSIEAQVAELESQDPSFEDDESPEYCPRTKQSLHMLLRDLDTMEELGVIT